MFNPNALFSLPRIDHIPSWDCVCMSMIFLISTRSKDRQTKVGACLLMDDKSMYFGFNGLGAGCNDEILDGPAKYPVVIHGESNAMNRAGRALCWQQKELCLYIPFKPCPRCASQMVDFNVKRVVYFGDYKSNTNDEEIMELIRHRGFKDGTPAFSLEKYNAEPLFFHHQHFGVKYANPQT